MTVAEPSNTDALRIRHEFLALPELRASVACFALLLNVSMRHALLMLEPLRARMRDQSAATPLAIGRADA